MATDLTNVTYEELFTLMKNKFIAASLPEEQADEVARHLAYADMWGIHSHGAVRVEYYAERIAKGGYTLDPELSFEKTGPSTGIYHGDNAMGHYVANLAVEDTIKMAKENGVAIVGISKVGHTGALSYYADKISKADLIAISMTVSDPMVVPFGGTETYYGTNPISFSFPRKDEKPVIFDMATSVQAWGKVLDARSKNKEIPSDWAVDSEGNPTTDPHNVSALLPIAGPKGYGLMMMVDVLSAMMLGLPFGKNVSSMYDDLSKGRDLGQVFIAIDPSRFTDLETFKESANQMVEELHSIKPAEGFDQVYHPGERSNIRFANHEENGVDIATDIIEYLRSNVVHNDAYGNSNTFGDK